MNHPRSSGRLIITSLVCLALIASALLFVFNRVAITDWVRVQQYQPSAAIAGLATQAGMSEQGRYFFYTGEPVLEDAGQFNASCGEHEHSTAVLGCYAAQRIYLFDVQNDELSGIEEVTAAHETLHAAYERLSADEKRRVNAMITRAVPTLEQNGAFLQRMKVYDDLPEDERLNELHSVLGTEAASLPAELETYYGRYFTDRTQTTGLYAKYSGVFARLQQRSEVLAAEYNRLVAQRNALVEGANQEYRQLEADMATFERGPRTDAEQARALNARAAAYNSKLDGIRQQTATYDARLVTIKAELEQIAIHNQKLNDSIDSRIAVPAEGVHGG